MPDRLSPLDASFLAMESPRTPMHVGALVVLDPTPSGPLDPAAVAGLVAARTALVPRLRQRVRAVPGRHPVWVDDPDVDLARHVRTTALPPPGTRAQLLDLVGRVQAGPLDRSRPLWELHVVDGLAGGGTALVLKTHHALGDGAASVDAGSVLLGAPPRPPVVARPAPRDPRRTVRETAVGLRWAARTAVDPAPRGPLPGPTSGRRRFATATLPLDRCRAVRRRHGTGLEDVVLAVVAGALRRWSAARGEPTGPGAVRAFVPASVRAGSGGGNRVVPVVAELPVGEPDPVARLRRVRTTRAGRAGEVAAARRLLDLAALVPAPLHAAGWRAASRLSRRLYSLSVAVVPGPRVPRHVLGARTRGAFPVLPLAVGQALAIGVLAVDGALHVGVTVDGDAVPDVDVLAAALPAALDELVGA